MKKLILPMAAVVTVAAIALVGWYFAKQKPAVSSFEECAKAGYPILQTYPRGCKDSAGKTFTEDIGNAIAKLDVIHLSTPRPNDLVKSPLKVIGEARGYWFFEASFPVKLLDGNGRELGIGIAQAKSDWMTENFVAFEVNLEFQTSTTKKGTLVLKRDNPSGLPQNDDELTIPVSFITH
jgi:hypothetical protein